MTTQALVIEHALDDPRILRTRIIEARRDAFLDELNAAGLCEVYKLVHLQKTPLAKAARKLEIPFSDIVARDNQIREIIERDLASQPPVPSPQM